MKDEKFISIDFQRWETKYKPMEAELEDTKKELQSEKESKKLYIYLKMPRLSFTRPIFMSDQSKISCIAYYDIDTEEMEENCDISEMGKLRNMINGKLEETFFDMHSSKPIIYTTEDGRGLLKELIEKEILLNKALNKVNSLPRIVKWLFKIKNV